MQFKVSRSPEPLWLVEKTQVQIPALTLPSYVTLGWLSTPHPHQLCCLLGYKSGYESYFAGCFDDTVPESTRPVPCPESKLGKQQTYGIFSTEGEENVSLDSCSFNSLSLLGPVMIIAGLAHIYVQGLCLSFCPVLPVICQALEIYIKRFITRNWFCKSVGAGQVHSPVSLSSVPKGT